jgi:hypothetical protein
MDSRVALARRLAVAAVTAFLVFVVWGIYRAGQNETPPPPTSTDIVFHDGFANGERIKTRSWTAKYDRIISNADQTVLDLDNVHDGTIYKKGKPYLRVRAAHMTVNTITRDFSVTGPLHVETIGAKPARSFDTTAADWSDAQQRLSITKRAPLMVGGLVFDVKSGQIDMTDVSGPVRFK